MTMMKTNFTQSVHPSPSDPHISIASCLKRLNTWRNRVPAVLVELTAFVMYRDQIASEKRRTADTGTCRG